MAKHRIYTDEERAAVYLALQINDGNVRKSARETDVPTMTVQSWKKNWDQNGVPYEIESIASTDADIFVRKATSVRDMALDKLKERIPETTNAKDLAMIFGILEDKIRLAKGLATSRTEKVQPAIDAAQVTELMGALVKGALGAAEQRDEDIVDAEIVESGNKPLKALPAH